MAVFFLTGKWLKNSMRIVGLIWLFEDSWTKLKNAAQVKRKVSNRDIIYVSEQVPILAITFSNCSLLIKVKTIFEFEILSKS